MPDTATRPTSSGAASLSVFFPCFNEQDNIRRVYESAAKVLGDIGMDWGFTLISFGLSMLKPFRSFKRRSDVEKCRFKFRFELRERNFTPLL